MASGVPKSRLSGISVHARFLQRPMRCHYPFVSRAASRRRLISIEARQTSLCLGPPGWGLGTGCFLECNRGGRTDACASFVRSLISDAAVVRRLAVVGRSVGRKDCNGWAVVVLCSRSIMLSHPPPPAPRGAGRRKELGEYMARLTHYERFIDRTHLLVIVCRIPH